MSSRPTRIGQPAAVAVEAVAAEPARAASSPSVCTAYRASTQPVSLSVADAVAPDVVGTGERLDRWRCRRSAGSGRSGSVIEYVDPDCVVPSGSGSGPFQIAGHRCRAAVCSLAWQAPCRCARRRTPPGGLARRASLARRRSTSQASTRLGAARRRRPVVRLTGRSRGLVEGVLGRLLSGGRRRHRRLTGRQRDRLLSGPPTWPAPGRCLDRSRRRSRRRRRAGRGGCARRARRRCLRPR